MTIIISTWLALCKLWMMLCNIKNERYQQFLLLSWVFFVTNFKFQQRISNILNIIKPQKIKEKYNKNGNNIKKSIYDISSNSIGKHCPIRNLFAQNKFDFWKRLKWETSASFRFKILFILLENKFKFNKTHIKSLKLIQHEILNDISICTKYNPRLRLWINFFFFFIAEIFKETT